jgi:hypothetical protein
MNKLNEIKKEAVELYKSNNLPVISLKPLYCRMPTRAICHTMW